MRIANISTAELWSATCAGDLEEKINDYLAFGVQYVWVINPDTRRAYSPTPNGGHETETKDGVLRAESAHIEIPLSEIFQ